MMSELPQLPRRLRLFDATTLVVGSMIGSAIFFALSYMAQQIETPGILIGLWLLGGAFTVLGAMCFAELAAMIPHAGGQYVFLREAFGKFWAFLFGWTQLLVIQSGFNAAVALAFAKYLGALVPWLGEENALAVGDLVPAAAAGQLPDWLVNIQINSAQPVACAVIVLLTVVNICGVREGAFVQNLFTVLKVAAITILIVLGLAHASDPENFFPLTAPIPGAKAMQAGIVAGMAVALSKALFAYDAWYTVTFVAEEVQDPPRNLPRALL